MIHSCLYWIVPSDVMEIATRQPTRHRWAINKQCRELLERDAQKVIVSMLRVGRHSAIVLCSADVGMCCSVVVWLNSILECVFKYFARHILISIFWWLTCVMVMILCSVVVMLCCVILFQCNYGYYYNIPQGLCCWDGCCGLWCEAIKFIIIF